MMIAHLSDSQLLAGALAGEPATALNRAFGRLLALEPPPDCVVITGDLVETAGPGEYAVLRDILDRCPIPVHVVGGNHDGERLVDEHGGTRYLAGGTCLAYAVDYPEATVIVADSPIPGRPEGRLGAGQLRWIDETLGRRPDVPAIICLHHPPVTVGIPFPDGMGLLDAAELGEVIARRGNVARVLAGHVHPDVAVPFAGTLVSIASATYRQSAPGPTSFLLHVLTGDGCATHAVPAGDVFAY
jgi:Icc protein